MKTKLLKLFLLLVLSLIWTNSYTFFNGTEEKEERGVITEKIDINKASLEELVELPFIGEKKAQAIIDYREEHGEFESVEALEKVEGIGEQIIDNIRDMVTVN